MKLSILALGALLVGALAISGCSANNMTDDGLNKAATDSATRVDTIAKQSGGDWSKISPADKEYLIKEVGGEKPAQRLVETRGGARNGGGGGGKPAAGGPAGG